jgi:arsenate reductase-like glutaredoxin family protein
LDAFLQKVGFEGLVNKKGTTFRKLSEGEKQAAEDKEGAINLLLENSSMIKRPIIQFGDGELLLGYEEDLIMKKTKTFF